MELQSVKRQCESVKMLLAENTTEKDIMYEVSRVASDIYLVLTFFFYVVF
jgi:hypothetical protein